MVNDVFRCGDWRETGIKKRLLTIIVGLYYCFIASLLISNDNRLVSRLFYLASVLLIIFSLLAAWKTVISGGWKNHAVIKCYQAPPHTAHYPLYICGLWLVLFIGFTAISSAWSDHSADLPRVVKHGVYILLFYAMTCALSQQLLYHHRLLHLFIIVCVGSVLLNILVYYQQQPINARLMPRFGPVNIIDYAGFLCLAIIFTCWLLTQTRQYRVLYSLLLMILLSGLALSQSRMPMISVIVSLFILFSGDKKRLLMYSLLLLLLFIVVLSCYSSLFTRDAVAGMPTPRIYTWLYVWRQISEHNIWWGFGYGNTFAHYFPLRNITYNNAHGIFSSVLYYSGIIGLTLLMIGIAVITHLSWRVRKINPLPLALCAFVMIHNMTQGYKYIYHPIETWLVLWFPLFLALAITKSTGHHEKYQ